MSTHVQKQEQNQNRPTCVLVFANGDVFYGQGCGAQGQAVAELCFNTAMTGYQEILTDPSYADQIILFTFPHIGNTGANTQDEESACDKARSAARGMVIRDPMTKPSSWRHEIPLDTWLKDRGIIGLSGVDTRAITSYIREHGMQNAVIAHDPEGNFDIPALQNTAQNWAGVLDADLAATVSTPDDYAWDETKWTWPNTFEHTAKTAKRVVVIDYGVKENILRSLASAGLASCVVPADMSAADIIAKKPDGIVLSNGPGDPAATGKYAIAIIQDLIKADLPLMGICLGHQLLALALGGKTIKMEQGHHGANHPVKDMTTDKVEIVSMNHGFAVDSDSLPEGISQTHISLFDGSNCGLQLEGKPVFSVQYHPEANPGPRDSFYLFERFAKTL
jgi:carbamoyl-phosphate synthase small subunit